MTIPSSVAQLQFDHRKQMHYCHRYFATFMLFLNYIMDAVKCSIKYLFTKKITMAFVTQLQSNKRTDM